MEEGRTEARVVVACPSPCRDTVLVEELDRISAPSPAMARQRTQCKSQSEDCTGKKSREADIANERTLYRSLFSGDRKIWEMTPSLANRSCISFTPGFLSGLHGRESSASSAKGNAWATHCNANDFLRYALVMSDSLAEGSSSSHE